MNKLRWAACLMIALAAAIGPGRAETPDLYRAVAIVTGQGETNRQLGFKDCLAKVLVRVSGDPRVASGAAFEALQREAGRFVGSFSYRDRLEGVPIHDEQGTHDRPHDLTCVYDHATIDGILARLGSRPWLERRPTLAVFLLVDRGGRRFVLTPDKSDVPYMRESFALAAEPLALSVVFPLDTEVGRAGGLNGPGAAEWAELAEAAKAAGADQPLVGSIVWSDADRGWVADWRLLRDGEPQHWQVRGVSFDEAFRVAIRGSAQVLSGNGTPR